MAKKSSKQKFSLNRKMALIGGAVVIVALLIVGGWFAMMKLVQPTPSPESEFTRERQLDEIARDADQKAQEANNVDEGAKVYDKAIDETDDKLEKSQLMASKASVYLNDGKYDEALTIALEADKVQESSEVSALIAQIYESKGDKAKAADYYAKAARLVNTKEPMGLNDKQYYENQAKQLRGGQ